MAKITISMDKLKELAKAIKVNEEIEICFPAPTIPTSPKEAKPEPYQLLDKYGNLITYNNKQLEAINYAREGKDFVLIGPAGTGKTTCMKGVTLELIQSGRAGNLNSEGHKYLRDNTPGIVVCAYTRIAVRNIRKNMDASMKDNCITIHKLLEYSPVYYEVQDPETGETKEKMSFQPTRDESNPLPSSIKVIIFEEASMLALDLYKEVIRACRHKVHIIFLGDIQQLPPVFGPAILGFKLLELPVVELTEVYRQALESPIIRLAHRILKATPITKPEIPEWKIPGQMTIRPWQKKISPDMAMLTIVEFFKQAYDSGAYNSNEDMILMPFNKAFGTIELNLSIANHIAKKNNSTVYQVIAGFQKYHFRIGERVLYDKEDAEIIDIEPNLGYTGANYIPASCNLDYWGFTNAATKGSSIESSVRGSNILDNDSEDEDEDTMDDILEAYAAEDVEDRVRKASHIITLKLLDSDVELKLDTASAINSLLLGYALTVHKAQGSEWKKVFFVMHQSNNTMIQRELLYTGVTRAREELYVICENETFIKGIKSQRVKGDTIAEKAEFFKGKLSAGYSLNPFVR